MILILVFASLFYGMITFIMLETTREDEQTQ